MATAGAEGGREGTIRVLLVDDVPEMRELIRFGLEQNPDFEVVGEAGDGRGAIESVESLGPDAILLDLSMPDVDGFQAVLEIRALRPGIAIVVLSGFAADRMREKVMDRGADAYVEKGTAIAQISDLLKRAVAERRALAEPSAA